MTKSRALILLISIYGCAATSADLPCAAKWREEGQGYVCVCNSTYCDTVEVPERLQKGYYLYKTSNSTPGFTKTAGNFSDAEIPHKSDITFTINSSVEYQDILGFGGALTDSTLININNLPEEVQEKFIESYFGPSGIEYNMVRIPIGGTDFSTRRYTLDDTPFDEDLSHFSLAEEDYNLRIPFIKKANSISRKDIKILACTWAPPSWMQNINTTGPEYIKKEYNEVWAKYHIKFLDAYTKENITLWSISGGNEDILIIFLMDFLTPSLNSIIEYAPAQRFWLKNDLKPQLVASGYEDVKVLALEDMRFMALYYLNRLASDPEAYKAVDGLAFHWYSDFIIEPTIMDKVHALYPDKLIIYTETSINANFGSASVSLGSWYRASGYLYDIFENLNYWTNGYLDWNLALDEDGGPTFSYGIDCPIIVNQTSREFYKQPLFYVMGHFSKFIQPGAKRVQVLTNDTTPNPPQPFRKSAKESLQALASLAKLRHGVVDDSSPTLTIPQGVHCLAFSNPDESFTVMVLSTKNETVTVKITDHRVGFIVLPIEENSINTFIYWPTR